MTKPASTGTQSNKPAATQAWWSNERTHTHARYGWLAAGWRVTGVNMNGLSVTFESGPV